MRERIICVMARMLDQDDGLGVYARNLLEHLLEIDRSSRYLILLRTDKCKDLFAHHPRADVRVLPARISDRVMPGNCFAPFHWNDLIGEQLAINAATCDAVDPLSLV